MKRSSETWIMAAQALLIALIPMLMIFGIVAMMFGSGYIPWAIRNYGGHSELSALEFSEMMANRNSWESYGDPYYVSHVFRYLK